jgi:hypothetical protein
MSDPIHEAALTLLLGVSEKNLASGETAMVLVYRPNLNALRDTFEASHPGVLSRARARLGDYERMQASYE